MSYNSSIEKYSGQSFILEEIPLVTRTGYTFSGWFNDDEVLNTTYILTENTSFTASWIPITYTIQYVTYGGINPEDAVTSYTIEDNITLPIPTNSDEDKIFAGWYESPDFSTSQISEWSAGTKKENLSFYAKWRNLYENITAENVVETINNLQKSATIKINGTINESTISQIRLALLNLATDKPDIEVGLDLSEVLELLEIPTDAFASCINLVNLELPESVNSIGNYAFRNCSKLVKMVIPKNVVQIGGSIFSGCSSLEELTIPFIGGYLNSSQVSATSLFGYIFGTSNYNGAYPAEQWYPAKSITYYLPSALKKVTINKGFLLDGAFRNCSSLVSIILPKNITEISTCAFLGCTGLTSISIPSGVTSIEYSAFSGCTGLTSITFPSGITTIGSSSFYGCTGLTNITIPPGVKKIEDTAFSGCTGLTSITLHSGVTTIGHKAFANCSGLTIITLPIGVTTIEFGAFLDCTGLTNITLPIGLTTIGNSAFLGCSNLTSINISVGVTTIGNSAFSGCSKLTNIIIPDSVGSIGENVFSGCSNLKELTIPFIGSSPNQSQALESTLFGYYFGNSDYEGAYEVKNSYSSQKKYYLPSTLTKVVVKGGKIFDRTFYDCSSIEEIIMLENVIEIRASAFEDCTNLKNVTIPNGINIINEYLFSGCSSLESITLSNTTKTIYDYAFNSINLEQITIPESVTLITRNAFSGSQISAVELMDKTGWYKTNNQNETVLWFSDLESCDDQTIADRLRNLETDIFKQ